MFMDQMKHLEREKAALSKELKEMRDLEEFNTLEDGFRKEQEVTDGSRMNLSDSDVCLEERISSV